MSVVKILQYPDLRLKRRGQDVQAFSEEVKQIIADMFETNYAADNCAALAATQLDFDNPYNITVIDLSAEKNEPICLVNPEIYHREGEQYEYEGCMSVGDSTDNRAYEKVKRAMYIKVRALNEKGEVIDREAEGYLAKCIQHEVDHLQGKLFIDHLSKLKRERLLSKLAKNRKRSQR